MMLRSWVPAPLPGESIYSLAAAFAAKWFRGRRRGAALLFDGRRAGACDTPSRLPKLAAHLPRSLCLSPTRLALKHTSVPLHLPFLEADRRRDLLRRIAEGRPLQLALRSATTRVTTARGLRLCDRCREEDRGRYGRSYWHLIHQLPGVLVCPRHGLPLVVTSVEAEPDASAFVVPDRAETLGRERACGRQLIHARALSEQMAALLRGCGVHPGPARMHAYYHRLLADRGYRRRNGSIALTRLCADLRRHYGDGFLARLDCRIPATYGWVATLARYPQAHQHPLRHLLLLSFLGQTADALKEAMKVQPRRRRHQPHAVSAELAPLVPRKRRAWLQTIAALTAGSAREGAPNLYTWLWRNDRTWLLQHRPARRIVRRPDLARWAERDAALAGLIPRLTRQIMTERPPCRASRSEIARRTGHAVWLVKDHRHLPRSVAAIKAATESSTAFVLRRLAVVTRGRPVAMPRWRLAKQAGISVVIARRRPVAAALWAAVRGYYSRKSPRPSR